MASSRFLKTPKVGIVLQVTEVASLQGRLWEVHDVERNRGFRVHLEAKSLEEAPAGKPPLGRGFTETEIDGALGLAVERMLLSPGEKTADVVYEVIVESQDLYDYVALAG